jgi:hypothetical protein
MRIITGIAIALTTLFLSLLAAHAEGTWCANYGGNGGTNCGFYSLRSARRPCPEPVVSARRIRSSANEPINGDPSQKKSRRISLLDHSSRLLALIRATGT